MACIFVYLFFSKIINTTLDSGPDLKVAILIENNEHFVGVLASKRNCGRVA